MRRVGAAVARTGGMLPWRAGHARPRRLSTEECPFAALRLKRARVRAGLGDRGTRSTGGRSGATEGFVLEEPPGPRHVRFDRTRALAGAEHRVDRSPDDCGNDL